MAALGKIRSKGALLIGIIGLGLFAFIAEEGFRSCETSRNDQRQQIGEVLGEKVNVQDFQKLVDEYTEVIKMQQGTESLNDDQMNQVKDMVWNSYVQTKIVEKEAHELGLTVTDQEMQNILNQGTNPMLMQTPFVNQQTGRFDANALKRFLAEYKTQKSANPQMAKQYEVIYKYWVFIEKTLRQQTLAQKYQSLLAHCILSNPVEAKQSFQDENVESQVQLAAFPYSSVEDNKVNITKQDIKDKYDELKARFKQYVETRDIKYVDVVVTASAADRAALQKDFATYADGLAAAADPTDVVRKSTSLISYLGIPVAKDAFPADIATRLDSMAVGAVYGPVETKQDNTLNLIKLVAKDQLPDSVQYREIRVTAVDADAAHKSADSIYTALQGGADFEALAKKYGQTGEKQWLTTRQYENAPSLDNDTKGYIRSLNTMSPDELKNITLPQGNIIVQVLDRRAMITKYTAAVIKKTIDYSRDTRTAVFNKFNSFAAANMTADDIVKNAKKNGYTVQERKDVSTSDHYLAGIHSTRDAMKWLFEAKEGAVSPLYECGNNGDNLLIVILDKIHHVGYRSIEDPQIAEMLRAEVLKDKKADVLMDKAKGVKTIAAAQQKGAKVSTINQITFASPVFITETGASEPALSGAVSATPKGKFSAQPVKGEAGVYLFQVTARNQRPGKFDDPVVEARDRQRFMQNAGNFMNELYVNAKVVDNRYLFF